MSLLLIIIIFFIDALSGQYASKCNLPLLNNWSVDFRVTDYRYPTDHVNIDRSSFKNTVDFSDNKFPFWEDFGWIWELSRGRDYVDIGFTLAIRITGLLVNYCEIKNGTCLNMTTDSISLRIHYKNGKGVTSQLKDAYFRDGDITLEELYRTPKRVSFNSIETDHITVSVDSLTGFDRNKDHFIQLELYGCLNLPSSIYSINPHILHYDLAPRFDAPSSAVYAEVEGWCSEQSCDGIASTLIDGIIVYNGRSSPHLVNKWSNKGIDGQNISVKFFFDDLYKLDSMVIHGMAESGNRNWFGDLLINGKPFNSINKLFKSSFHSKYVLEGLEADIISLEFQMMDDHSLTLSEIEFFGIKNQTISEEGGSEIEPWTIGIILSILFFAIILLIIIPIIISVRILYIRTKKQAIYFPVAPQIGQPRTSTNNLFSSQEVVRSIDSIKPMPEESTNQNSTSDAIIRTDTSVLNNYYERIPTLPTAQGNDLRESLKVKRSVSPLPPLNRAPPDPTKFPIYSLPVKRKETANRLELLRPLSQDGYLQLMESNSVDNTGQEQESPMYDYVRPSSAVFQFSDNSMTKSHSDSIQQPSYVNSGENSTNL